MALPTIDWPTLTEAELKELFDKSSAQLQRLAIPKQMATMNGDYLASLGREPGQPWVQPTGAHDAYPKGWKVTHEGKEWESKIPANVWPPGQDPNGLLWKDLTTVVSPGAWAPGVVVTVGQVVTYQGRQYKALQAHTTQAGWTPPVVPALWALVVETKPAVTPTTTTPRK